MGRYEILVAPTIHELAEQVQTYVKSGWTPAGGVATTRTGNYMQAVYWREQ